MRNLGIKKILLLMFLVFSVAYAGAATPQTLVTESTMLAGQTRTAAGNTYAHAIDGQTAYVAFMKGGVTKVENLNGTQVSSTLFTHTAWSTISGGATSLTVFYGFGVSGNYLIWTDSPTDAIWKADKTTGVISSVASKSAIQTYLGGTAPASLASFTVAPNGGLTFFESSTKSLLNVALNGTISTIMPAGFTANSITSGLAYDAAGRIYWGDNTADAIYRRTTSGTIETVLTSADVYGLTAQTNATFNDIFYGDNGWVYVYEAVDNSILQFNLSNPTSTLSLLVDTSGRANTFGLYQNAGLSYLTYHNYTGDLMAVQIVPEPATLSLLLLGGLGLIRRNKK